MKQRPILFSTPMVQALLAGSKTQTRRIAKAFKVKLTKRVKSDIPVRPRLSAQPGIYTAELNQHGAASLILENYEKLAVKPSEFSWVSPYGQPGDVLWVRETFDALEFDGGLDYYYKADFPDEKSAKDAELFWRPSIHMPKEAARIWLRITDVRVERLQDISEADAIAEGIDSDTQRLPYSTLFTPIYRDYTVKEKGASSLKSSPFCLHSAVTSYGTLWTKINGPGSWAANPWVWAITFERCEKP